MNSFGYGGANAHVVLEDAYNYMKIRGIVAKHRTLESPPRFEEISPTANGVPTSPINHAACADFSDGCSCRPRPRLLIWSAAEEAGIKRLAKNYQEHLLKKHNYRNGYLDDFAYTLSNRRSKLPWKSFLIAETTDDIRQWLPSKLTQPVRSVAENLKLGFVFTGQGAQWYAMGRDLLLYPIFRESLRSAEKFLQMLGCEWQLIGKAGATALVFALMNTQMSYFKRRSSPGSAILNSRSHCVQPYRLRWLNFSLIGIFFQPR